MKQSSIRKLIRKEINKSINEGPGQKHYTKDGKEWTGLTHKMPDGTLMTGDPHNKDSEKLSHKEGSMLSRESVNESQQPVTKSDWDTADSDQRVDWLLQVFKDPDKAEQHAETEWENLPNTAPANMYLEGTCGYSIDGKGGDKPAGPHLFKDPKNLKESAIGLGYLKESTRVELGSLKRPIDVSIEDGVIMAGDKHKSLSKLKSITTAYATPGGGHYRDYLHTEEGQINLSGDENDFSHIASALGMEEGGNPIEFFKGFGVEWESREFDVS